MEKRKIIYQNGSYQLLKPKCDEDNGSWHTHGKIKTLKAISDLMENKAFNFEISEDIMKDIERYRENSAKRVKRHFNKKTLESKAF